MSSFCAYGNLSLYQDYVLTSFILQCIYPLTHFVYTCEKTRIMKLIKLTNQLSECIKRNTFIITESKEHKFRIAIKKKKIPRTMNLWDPALNSAIGFAFTRQNELSL